MRPWAWRSATCFTCEVTQAGVLVELVRAGIGVAIVSRQIAELEKHLDVRLLNRTTRQFSMTEAGHTYYRTASDILKEIDNLADLVRENNAQLKGRLRISVPRTGSSNMVHFFAAGSYLKI